MAVKRVYPVSAAAVLKRVNRILAKDSGFLKKTRGKYAEQSLGLWWGIDEGQQIRVDNLEEYARRIGALQEHERLV